jgi:hypothetical protein
MNHTIFLNILKSHQIDVYDAGKSSMLLENLTDRIDLSEVTCLIGAGDMDQYFQKMFDHFKIDQR